VLIPYPLKMDAKGQLLPEERRWVYAPVDGHVMGFAAGLEPGSQVFEGQDLIKMYDVNLNKKLLELKGQIDEDRTAIDNLAAQASKSNDAAERSRLNSEKEQKQAEMNGRKAQFEAMMERTHSVPGSLGYFWLKSPMTGTVLNSDFREQLTNRYVKPSEQLLRIGNKEGNWEVELKIPQKHIGQVLRGFEATGQTELDVDILLSSKPTVTYRGKLARDKIGGEATPNRDDNNESEPVVIAYVRLDGPGIPEADRVPRSELIAGTEVHSKVRCGNRAMGYSLFYGVWEFVYEKVIFWF
jgi:hypothetical protein